MCELSKKQERTDDQPSLSTIFLTFFKIGAFTFGGGYAMLPLIRAECVENKNWLSDQDFLDILAIAQSVPGALAVNSAILIGHRLRGYAGTFTATLGTALPSFLIILTIAIFFLRYQQNPLVQAAFRSIRPAVAALIAAAALKLGRPVFCRWGPLIFFGLFFLAGLLLNLHPILIILSGGASGLLFFNLLADGEDQP